MRLNWHQAAVWVVVLCGGLAFGQERAPDAGLVDGGMAFVPTPAEAPKTRYFEGMGKTPEQRAMLEELSRALAQYEEESRDFKREIQLLVKGKYDEKRSTLAGSYEKALIDLEVLERKRAARRHRRVRRVPARGTPTMPATRPTSCSAWPSSITRSARRTITGGRDARLRSRSLKKLDPEKNPTPPPEPKTDYGRSIALYQKLLGDFPAYKLNDASWYLLGYCQEKQDDFKAARSAYESLIAAYPKSKFTIEAWVRLGEYYFDADPNTEPDPLPKAIIAYGKAIEDPKHPLFDKALYKLGWVLLPAWTASTTPSAQFIAAHRRFRSEPRRSRKVTTRSWAATCAAEALQYTAISFVDERLGLARQGAGDLRQDRRAPLRGRDLPPHGRRLLRPDAAPAGHRGLPARAAEGPAHQGRAPDSSRSIVQAYERDRQARRGVRRVVEAGQHVRAGHAVAREVEARPRRGFGRRRAGREEPVLDGHLPPPTGAGLQAGAASSSRRRPRSRPLPRPTRATWRASPRRRTPTTWSSTGPTASTTRSSSPRPPSTTPRFATRPRT
jgi:tetratricopeptide (TPR) repeat protein